MIRPRDSRLAKVEAHLDERERVRGKPGEDEAMPLIWEVLERYPMVKAEVERIKGIREMSDEEALPLMMDILDNNPEVKAALLARIVQAMEQQGSNSRNEKVL